MDVVARAVKKDEDRPKQKSFRKRLASHSLTFSLEKSIDEKRRSTSFSLLENESGVMA
jgi:hypothetical protein